MKYFALVLAALAAAYLAAQAPTQGPTVDSNGNINAAAVLATFRGMNKINFTPRKSKAIKAKVQQLDGTIVERLADTVGSVVVYAGVLSCDARNYMGYGGLPGGIRIQCVTPPGITPVMMNSTNGWQYIPLPPNITLTWAEHYGSDGVDWTFIADAQGAIAFTAKITVGGKAGMTQSGTL